MQIVAPTPNAVTGPDFTVKIDVQGGRVVRQTTGKLTSDEATSISRSTARAT